jgi:putative cell wall-binding protein
VQRSIRHGPVGALIGVLLVLAASPSHAASATDIVAVGGPEVLSDALVAHLETCTDGTATRVAGANRYATAVAVSKRSFPTAGTVYIATGMDFPDALTTGPVAAANDAPILLVRTDSIPSETLAELDRLMPPSIVILGGASAVSAGIDSSLRSRYPMANVDRIAGSDRYETAASVSRSHFAPGVPAVYVAVGSNFPDALAGGAAAAVRNAPVLLTEPGVLPAATALELARLEPHEIVILGGTSVVSSEIETQLSAFTNGAVRRLAGSNRLATAAAVANDGIPDTAGTITITTALDFPDALAATPTTSGPLLLASDHSVHVSTASAISHFTGAPCGEFEERLGPILAIGDSVMAGASKEYAPAPNLESEILDMTVDADVNRPFSRAETILASALAGTNPPQIVVIHLGTNGPPTSAQFVDLMAVAKNVPKMLFLTVKLDKSWETTTNAVIRANVALYANAQLVDWWALAAPHPEWFSSDVNCGCHLWRSTARQAYINLISTAVGG